MEFDACLSCDVRIRWTVAGVRIALLADSCTTGWLNWGHGELWLTPDHVVRIGRRELTLRSAAKGGAIGGAAAAAGGLGLLAVQAAGKKFASTRPAPGAVVEVEKETWAGELDHQPKALILGRDDIDTLDYRPGISSSRLRIRMTDGSEHKLLWLPNPHAEDLLAQAFGPRLHRS
ncbi:hypothetical protein V6S67_07520 [Arthrobacter sp. Soc17.1.1.1]|uniref:hypothetical protein n=1 Tax=Arthrobacter sp. Soc17.1.1.1 TaxID=3121277 RepID=UPI002FE45ECC